MTRRDTWAAHYIATPIVTARRVDRMMRARTGVNGIPSACVYKTMATQRRNSALTRGSAKLTSSLLIFATLAIGIIIGTVISHDAGAADEKAKAAPDATPLVVPDPVPTENQFAPIVDAVSPAVVNIQVEQYRTEASAGGGGGGEDDRMQEFFRRFFGMPNAPEGLPQPTPRGPSGQGSGFIVDAKGYIITNNHVIDGADRVRVRFAHGGENELFDAEVIGADEETDIAVIKVDPSEHDDLVVARIGNSDAVRVGDWAIAIGSPFGFRESVTIGVISAQDREVHSARRRVQNPFQRFFQTDAAINPGNSGGPLVNIRGEVIGVNTAIVSNTGAYQGLGFSLPSNEAVKVYNQIIQHGRVARGSIGITFQNDQSPALLRSFGAENGGVLVGDVKEGGPAAEAGMRGEDVIVKIDGQDVPDGDTLIAIVAGTPVGSSVPVEIIRDGARQTLDVEIADRQELFAEELGLGGEEESDEPTTSEVDLGISVQNLTAERLEQLELDEKGVIVTDVEPGSFAEDIGLVPNDVIVAINRKPVAAIGDIRDIRDSLKPGDDVAFKVLRRGPAGWTAQYAAGVLPNVAEEGGDF